MACGESQPLDAFYRDKSRSDGLARKCRACLREYNRQYRRKNNTAPIGPDYLVDRETGCWTWQKCLNADGYGQIIHGGKKWIAHRWFYTQHVGEIPAETLHHECANKLCVNPAHLQPMSFEDHARLEWEQREVAA